MSRQTLEGSWEEIIRHADELVGKTVRLTVLDDIIPEPNLDMLAALKNVGEIQQGMRFTAGDNTQAILREARNGGRYRLGSDE